MPEDLFNNALASNNTAAVAATVPSKKNDDATAEADEMQQCEIDMMMESLDVDQLDSLLSLADGLAIRLAYDTTERMRGQIKSEKERIGKEFMRKKMTIERYMKTAKFTRLFDKINFIVGVMLLVFTTYIVGRYPHRGYYQFHTFIILSLVIFRFFNYRKKGWHYYLFDFCYFANTLMLLFLNFFPHSDHLFKVFFVYANGPFGVAIPAFKNSMIFHKLDNLISVTIHLIPQVTSWNLRWHTIPWEKDQQQKYFLTLNEEEPLMQYLNRMFVIPLLLYLLWAGLYSLKVFVISSKKIKERNYETMYVYYMDQPWAAAILSRFGLRLAPLVFMSLHVTFFVISSIFALLAYQSFYLHTFLLMMWVTLSIWNGANFYMEYFSRKYEQSLRALEEVQENIQKE